MERTRTMALFGVLALAGCQNMGLYDAGPEGEAVVASQSELVAEVHATLPDAAGPPLIVDGQPWLRSGTPLAMGDTEVRSVGSAGGMTVYARSWDQAPYDALFVRDAGGSWRTYAPVLGGGSSAAPAGAGAADGH